MTFRSQGRKTLYNEHKSLIAIDVLAHPYLTIWVKSWQYLERNIEPVQDCGYWKDIRIPKLQICILIRRH